MDGIKINNDINIDINLLSTVLTKLKSDNEKISEIINLIYEQMNNIMDEKVWNSPEKEEMMEELIPYLEDTKTSLYDDLSNCLNVLNEALEDYTEDNRLLNKEAEEIIKIVEE